MQQDPYNCCLYIYVVLRSLVALLLSFQPAFHSYAIIWWKGSAVSESGEFKGLHELEAGWL